MLSPMARVQVVGSKRVLERVVETLHELGSVQIEDVTRELQPSEMLLQRMTPRSAEAQALDALLARAGAVLALLPPLPEGAPATASAEEKLDQAGLEACLALLEPACAEIAARRAALDGELASLRQYRHVVEKLQDLVEGPVELQSFETTAVIIHRKYRVALDLIRDELARLTADEFELVAADVDDESAVALIVFPRRHAAAVRSLLRGENFGEVSLPREYAGIPFREALARIREREAAIPREQAGLARRLAELGAAWRGRCLSWQAALADRREELVVSDRLAESKHAFVMEGWVPRKQIELLRVALAAVSAEIEVVELDLSPEEEHQAPVLLENWRIVRPFEFLMNILAPPRYGTIDPTPLMAVFFPLFFGMILGDVAYGLILLGASLYILRRPGNPAWLSQLCRIFVICSVPTILFGFAYGELFGNLGEHLGLYPLVVDRMHAIVPMLAFSIAIGAGKVSLGLVLGMVNGYLERKRKEILDKAAMLVALFALFAVVGAAADLLPAGVLQPGIAALLVALVVLLGTVGIVGPLEVFGVVGNVLSYSRLMAIGLSSVILAKVANDLAGITGSLVLGVMVAGLFHALNIALGVFSPSIQSLRLHYVEFFGKFYETGGQRFRPFRRSTSLRLEFAGQR